jgi:hypothetical protein
MKHATDLTLEVRSTDGMTAGFCQSDVERVDKALRFLSSPRLFAEPQLTLASEHAVTAIATRTIDMILAVFIVSSGNRAESQSRSLAAGADAVLINAPNLPRQLQAAVKTFFAHAGETEPQPR